VQSDHHDYGVIEEQDRRVRYRLLHGNFDSRLGSPNRPLARFASVVRRRVRVACGAHRGAGCGFRPAGYPLDLSSIPGRLVNFLPSAVILALIAGLGEEPGWRGFALPRLQTRHATVLATVLLGGVWAAWHLPLAFVDPRFPHGFTSAAPQILLALLTMLTIFFYAFFYTWVYNATRSVLLCMLLHGSFNAAIGLLPASFEVLQRGTYMALLVVQNVTLLGAVAILIVASRGLLAYDAAPERGPDEQPAGG
jgi:uncharacterized protein